MIVYVEVKNREESGVIIAKVDEPSFECKELEPTEAYFSPLQMDFAEFIAAYYCAGIGKVLEIFSPFSGTIPTLEAFSDPCLLKELSSEQNRAFEFLLKRPRALLFGDTGSGKTEIYSHLIFHHLRRGNRALFLMPEIGLAPQMEQRLKHYFGKSLAIWHSKLTKKRRKEVLLGLASGKIRLVIGTRSALFLPLERLGIIIVDEEHDDAYKSQTQPHYNARDLALWLGKKHGIQVVLGSATPLASSFYRFKEEEAIFRLKGQFFSAQKKIRFISGLDSLEIPALNALKATLEQGKQAMVFLPTRANFKYLLCTECGANIQCPRCSVSLSLHKKEQKLLCHHCNFASPIPVACEQCGAPLKSQRAGTAEVSEELCGHFPSAKIARFDRDVLSTQKDLEKTLSQFNKGEIDLLVGTQMLSKGHDYHNVELVLVLGIDYLLKSDDYRARERAMALLLQLIGRSGRKESGNVLIQSFRADFFKDCLSDYERFLQEELRLRQKSYPPFVRLGMIWFIHKDEERAKSACEEAFCELSRRGADIIAHGAAPIERIALKWRYFVLIRAANVRTLLEQLLSARGNLGEIDVDPVSFV